ncbi:MAG TPA: CHAD domain-containing protein [Bryobacterales bacterium]|nr:CHAD domain-containing protein [Bryobacterales bacterium]
MAKKKKLAWQAARSSAENARAVLPPLTEQYLRAARKLAAGRPSAKALHKFRLETKRFRYTLELFRPCYGPGLERRLETLARLQQDLGEINDCAVAQRLLLDGKIPAAWRVRMETFLEKRIASRRADLRQRLRSASSERGLVDYLRRFAGRKLRRAATARDAPRPERAASRGV